MGLQALLHVATAACARQGLSGQDQVRKHCFSATFQAAHHDFSKDVALTTSGICDRVELRLQQRPNRDELQALLHVATAACVRQGPSGPDQVRMSRFLVQLSTHDMFDQPRTESSDLVCRLSHGRQLQPVRGRDLRERIRSGCIDWFVTFAFDITTM